MTVTYKEIAFFVGGVFTAWLVNVLVKPFLWLLIVGGHWLLTDEWKPL